MSTGELRENTIIIGNGVVLPVCSCPSHISFSSVWCIG